MSIKANLNYLRSAGAKSGRTIMEDGREHNIADADQFRFQYDINRQAINNGAVEYGRRCSVLSAVSTSGYYYAINVAAGRELYIWLRTFVLSEGVYEVDLVSAPSGYTGGNNAYRKTLSDGGSDTVSAHIVCGVTPVDLDELQVIMQYPWVDTGVGQGNKNVAGADATLGVVTTFKGSTNLIRVKRTVLGDFRSSIFAVGWEESA
jgi:hypothetical protein